MKKVLGFALFLALFPSFLQAQNINPLDQLTSTTSPISAITQRLWGKAIKITGLTTGLCLSLDVNSLLTTTTCGSGGSGSDTNWTFFNTSGIRPATSTNQVLIGATATTTRAGLEIANFLDGSLLAHGSTTLHALTFTSATGTSATTTSIFSTTASTTNLFGTNINGFGLRSCNSASNAVTWASGVFGCNTITDNTASTTLLGDNNTFSGNNTFSSTITGSVSGNAGTATLLQNARTINGTSFNGGSNITITAASSTLLGDINTFSALNSFANLLVSGSSTLQNFTAVNATTSQATTTNLAISSLTAGQLVASNGVKGLVSTTTIGNNQLQNSSIVVTTASPLGGAGTIPLGGTLALTCTGCLTSLAGAASSTLLADNNTFSGTNNFATMLVLGSSTLQNFTGISATTTNATTTVLFSTTASTTNFFGGGLPGAGCQTTNAVTYNGTGRFGCVAIPQGTVTAVTATWPIISSGGATPAITWGGIATSSAIAAPQVLYATGVNTFASAATTSLVQSTGINIANGTTAFVIGSQPTFTIDQSFTPTWTGAHIFNTITRSTTTDATSTTGYFQKLTANVASFGQTATSTFNSTGDLLVVGSTTLQKFTATNSTSTNATTSSFAITNIATGNCLHTTAGGAVVGTGSDCGAGGGSGGNSKFATTTSLVDGLSISPNGGINTLIGIGTTTPHWGLQIASSTGPQLALTDANAAANLKHWTFRSRGGLLYIATSSDAYATSTVPALTINGNGYLGIGTSSPSAPLAVTGNIYQVGSSVHLGTVGCNSPLAGSGMEFCGNDNTASGVQIGVSNNNAGTSAYNGIYLNNDRADSSITHFGGLFQNSSAYTDTSFGTGLSYKNQVMFQNTDGLLTLISSTSTSALNPAGINFLVGGVTAGAAKDGGNEVLNLTLGGYAGIGTTTPKWLLQLATSTRSQLTFSTGNAADDHLSFRWTGSNFYIASSSATGNFATATTPFFNLDANKPASVAVGSTTQTVTAVNGLFTQGSNGANGSSTQSMGKAQWDFYNTAGTRSCMFVVGTTLTIVANACTP